MKSTLKAAMLALALALPAHAAEDDGYVMGAGRWTCPDAIRVAETGTESEVGQLVGWLLGYWSAATFTRETAFVDIVEQVGGQRIFEATVAECRTAPGETPLYVVTRSMIENTK